MSNGFVKSVNISWCWSESWGCISDNISGIDWGLSLHAQCYRRNILTAKDFYSTIRDFTQFGRNGASLKSIVTIWTMKSQSPEQCKVEVQIVRICGSNLEPWDFSAKILAMKCSDFTLHSGSVRFQYTSVIFSNLILAPTGAQEVALSVCESVCPCVTYLWILHSIPMLSLGGLSGVSQSSLRGISAFSHAFLVIVSEHKILHLVLLV